MIQLAKIVGIPGLVFLWQRIAHADNCGSLSDCFHTIESATVAAVGVAVTVIVGSLLDFFGWGNEGETPDPALPVYSADDPDADVIVQDAQVRAAMERAFTESHDNVLPEAEVREQGGWIVRLSNGDLDVVRWPEGEAGFIAPSPRPENAIAHFHTHPYGNDFSLEHKPSTTDSLFTRAKGIPGFVIDRQSIMRVDSGNPKNFRDVVLR